ncbi:MAG: DNA-directed RNA polymerase subunit K [Nanoarchaeota archaeon]|nr:DNA-directed RNA polymerase subunit K [Nanoarchaeota archaeon]
MPKERKVDQIYTKYEIARIIGARALQISMNAPLLLSLKKEELEEINYDSLKIAALEFNSGILPITVKRPLPQSKIEELEEEVPDEEKPEESADEEPEEKDEPEEVQE